VLELVGLAEHANRPLSGFSKGMLQRIGLAQALLHAPDLIFFDEPTSALDPLGRRLVRGIIQQVKAQGTTIFLNSHLLSEVEITCDRVAFIKDGVVLRTLSLRDIAASARHYELRVDAVTPELLAGLRPLVDEWRFLDDHTGEAGAECDDQLDNALPSALEFVADASCVPEVARAVLVAGARLHALTPLHTSLEQIFLETVGTEDSGQ
jgi:ABC-2 type transport system ATP-binding protein